VTSWRLANGGGHESSQVRLCDRVERLARLFCFFAKCQKGAARLTFVASDKRATRRRESQATANASQASRQH